MAEWMAYLHELKVTESESAPLLLRFIHELSCTYRHGRYALGLEHSHVVHTARRARPSVSDCSCDDVVLTYLSEQVMGQGTREDRLGEESSLTQAILLTHPVPDLC